MQMVKKIFVILVAFWIATILLAPKRDLYFFAQKKLQESEILLKAETIEETPFGVTLEKLRLSYNGLTLGTWKEVRIWSLIFYSEIDAKDFIPSAMLQYLFDGKIGKMRLRYSLLHPKRIMLILSGTLGTARGWIDVKKRIIFLQWTKIGKLGSLQKYMKRDKRGWYYERRF